MAPVNNAFMGYFLVQLLEKARLVDKILRQ